MFMYKAAIHITLFQKTLSEEKQKAFNPRPQGNMRNSTPSFPRKKKLTPQTIVADFYQSFLLNHSPQFKKRPVQIRFRPQL